MKATYEDLKMILQKWNKMCMDKDEVRSAAAPHRNISKRMVLGR